MKNEKGLTVACIGDMIKFDNESVIYTVRSTSDRYAILTRKLNKRKDAALLYHEVEMGAFLSFSEAYEFYRDLPIYTVFDIKNKIRGAVDLIFPNYDFKKQEDCDKCLRDMMSGSTHISKRNECRIYYFLCSVKGIGKFTHYI